MTTTAPQTDVLLDEIETHAFSDPHSEVGGVLVGTLDEHGARIFAALPALKAIGEQTNITFTHEVWDEVLNVIDADYPGQHIVGWYHTHPGFGLFLSEYDMFIHRNFFTDHRMVALVIDPLAGELGWFEWKGDEILLQERRPTLRPALGAENVYGTSSSAPAPARRNRPAALLAIPAVILMGAIGGYLLGSHSADLTVATQSSDLATARSQALAVQSQSDQLSRQLAATKTANPVLAVPTGAVTSIAYRVQPGDTLWRVAQGLYGDGHDYLRILKTNPHLQAQALHEGQVLTVPLPKTTITKKATNGG
jgi:proteasome lid subunit RPN8/RPN11/LysM repeat protein